MKITPIPHGLEAWIGQSTSGRGVGLHLSTLYNRLYEGLEPTRFVVGSTPDPLRLEAGLAFESFLETALKERFAGRHARRPRYRA